MMETLNQRPRTSAVPIDNNVHQLTLTCISILHTIANTILKSLIHDSSTLPAWGAMALKGRIPIPIVQRPMYKLYNSSHFLMVSQAWWP